MQRFFRHFLSLKHANLRTRAELRLFVIQLTILVLQTLRFWYAQPAAQHTFPGLKPAQILTSWMAHFARSHHFWRAVAEVLADKGTVVISTQGFGFAKRLAQIINPPTSKTYPQC